MTTPYVSEASRIQAIGFATRLALLPRDAGILFVAVQAQPAPGGVSSLFQVTLGMSLKVGIEPAHALLETVFAEERKSGLRFSLYATVGTLGAAAM